MLTEGPGGVSETQACADGGTPGRVGDGGWPLVRSGQLGRQRCLVLLCVVRRDEMQLRMACSGVLAVGLALGLVPLGCGGAEEEYTVVNHPQSEASAVNEWTVPEPVVEQLRGCVKEHASELKTHSHDAKFELKVTERGDVQGVKVRSSTLHHDAMESCMMQALATLSIPPSVLPMRSSEPFSGGESTRHDKGPLGVVQAAGAVVIFGPIILIAAGVTLGVYILATSNEEVRDEVLDAAKRTKKVNKLCDAAFAVCQANDWQPDWNIEDFGPKKDCGSCREECRYNNGFWPDYKCPRPNWRPSKLN